MGKRRGKAVRRGLEPETGSNTKRVTRVPVETAPARSFRTFVAFKRHLVDHELEDGVHGARGARMKPVKPGCVRSRGSEPDVPLQGTLAG